MIFSSLNTEIDKFSKGLREYLCTTATGMKTSQIKKLIGGMVTNLRAARAARTLE